jgi:Trypsin-co-occurring domain 2
MVDNAQPDGLVGLGAAIEALRTELADAVESGVGQAVRFRPGPIELTVQATVTRTRGGKAGLKWWLVEAGAERSRQIGATQTLKLVLQPVRADASDDADDLLLSGRDSRLPG